MLKTMNYARNPFALFNRSNIHTSARLGASALALVFAGAFSGCSLNTEGLRAGEANPSGEVGNGAGASSTNGGASGVTTGGGTVTPHNCNEILSDNPGATDGFYEIDPDGAGALPPFEAKCLMSVLNGGFTRFHWVTGDYPKDADPLGESLDQCKPDASKCLARIPQAEKPKDLLIREIQSEEYAHFIFDSTALSQAVLGALRDKEQTCMANAVPAFMPVKSTSTETYCSSGNKGGCDYFIYSESCNGASAWVLQLDDDGYYCQGAFKFGYSLEPGGTGCGNGDHGYMESCNCSKEDGEMYYR